MPLLHSVIHLSRYICKYVCNSIPSSLPLACMYISVVACRETVRSRVGRHLVVKWESLNLYIPSSKINLQVWPGVFVTLNIFSVLFAVTNVCVGWVINDVFSWGVACQLKYEVRRLQYPLLQFLLCLKVARSSNIILWIICNSPVQPARCCNHFILKWYQPCLNCTLVN